MAGVLVSGPAGAGKSAVARQILEESVEPAVMADFQTIYAGLVGVERDPETGRYPEREARHEYALPLAEYTRRAIITGAVQREIFVVATNSDGNPQRRTFLRSLLGGNAQERIVDPGRDVVESRLASASGVLSEQCDSAISRWYGRL